MSENNIAVKIDHVSKSFRLPTESSTSLRTTLVNLARGIKGYKEQRVLKDISFEVEKGDFFGIVGRNGSGKSTLLKIISQIYVPETGTVEVHGKLVSFIELGVGFNPELTGRENVYLNGSMLGFSVAEVDAMYDDIVEFAELGEFMNQKLKNYSSGMQVRLAFSVAIKAKGDVLVLDEVLAVGDESFQRKCNDYFLERKRSGMTTILVTHDMGAIKKYCNKAIYIKEGLIEGAGDPNEVAAMYSEANLQGGAIGEAVEDSGYERGLSELVPEFGLKLLSGQRISNHEKLKLELSYKVTKDIPVGFGISLIDTVAIAGSVVDTGLLDDEDRIIERSSKAGEYKFEFELPLEQFNSRIFKVEGSLFVLKNRDNYEFDTIATTAEIRGLNFVVTSDSTKNNALLQEIGTWKKAGF
ncbi:ABC transporter ATP-binding protein [Lactovum odontotermitis]